MLAGNTPPALISTHAYYQQHRWRRLISPTELDRHAAMHAGAGPTTAARWKQENWSDTLPPPAAHHQDPPRRDGEISTPPSGSLGRALGAEYPLVSCNRQARSSWQPGGNAIPDELRTDPGRWTSIELPGDLARELGTTRADLTNVNERRRALVHLLETGPADLIATSLTLPQLRAEWPHLQLSDMLRTAWEQCYPALGDDLTRDHPSRWDGADHPPPT